MVVSAQGDLSGYNSQVCGILGSQWGDGMFIQSYTIQLNTIRYDTAAYTLNNGVV